MARLPSPVAQSIDVPSGGTVVIQTSDLQAPIAIYYYPDPGATLTMESTLDVESGTASWIQDGAFTADGSGHLVARAQFLRVTAAGGGGRVAILGAL